jgi:hypothetical protein
VLRHVAKPQDVVKHVNSYAGFVQALIQLGSPAKIVARAAQVALPALFEASLVEASCRLLCFLRYVILHFEILNFEF